MRTLDSLPPHLPTEYPSPAVKWLGGKADLAEQILSLLPANVRSRMWHEPFVGGAAMFFRILPVRAILGDTCADLINLYEVLQYSQSYRFWDALDTLARKHEENPRRHYLSARDALNAQALTGLGHDERIDRAALFLYLNRAGFNGLHRVNAKGEFNVPVGSAKRVEFDKHNLLGCGDALRSASLHHASFESVLSRAMSGDVVYFDPPYVGTFSGYSSNFRIKQHTLLRDVFRSLDDRGVIVILSTCDHPTIRALYRDYEATCIQAKRSVSGKAASRGDVDELVIRGRTRR